MKPGFRRRTGRILNGFTNVILAGVALAMLGMRLNDRLTGPRAPVAATAPNNWLEEASTGLTLSSSSDSALTIIEFMDLECPFCAAWAARVDSLLVEFPGRVRLVMHHFPLSSIHDNAVGAAIALECADRQGVAYAFASGLLSSQGEWSNPSWMEMAIQAGLKNSGEFESCLSLPADSFPRIAYGIELGNRSGVSGTPTVWVNGRVERPSLSMLREMLTKPE